MIRRSRQARNGFSNFSSWLSELPDNISPMDVDFCLHRDGRLLIIEAKHGEEVPRGQRWALEVLARGNADVLAFDELCEQIAAPPSWAWKPWTFARLDYLVHAWCDPRRRGKVRAWLKDLGAVTDPRPL